MFDNNPKPSPQMVKKFYFLDYFLILLQSCKEENNLTSVFLHFQNLKDKLRLGESKYRKLTIDENRFSKTQVRRYIYTFEQVILEANSYGLIKQFKDRIELTEIGMECLEIAEKDKILFYDKMLHLMESQYFAFYHVIKFCYNQNTANNGVLIFPIYSPRKLGLDKADMKYNSDWIRYAEKLKRRLELDIKNYLGKTLSLQNENDQLLLKLEEDQLIGKDHNASFDNTRYNSIISRFRKFWLNYFLKSLYNYPFSFDTFNIWIERGMQLGIIHSTEFYPNFDGRLVFPTSIIVKKNNNSDLIESFNYSNGDKLFIHKPSWNNIDNQDEFIDALVEAFFNLRRNRRTQFIRLLDLRERVCYKMRIPNFIFNEFLQKTYQKSIKGLTRIQIALEADRLPYESNAMYLKREPILVNGQYKNIISIDYKK